MAAAFISQVGDINQVTVYCGQQNQLGINRLHYTVTNVNGPAQGADVVALALFDYFTPFYKPLLTNSASIINLGLKRIIPAPVTVEVLANPPAIVVGTGGNQPIPGQVSGILTKRTGLAGRKNRGRVYVPFPDESANAAASNSPTAAYLASLATLALQMKSPITFIAGGTTYTMDLQLFHRKLGTFTPTSDVITRPRWATQRRRGNYGRPNVAPA